MAHEQMGDNADDQSKQPSDENEQPPVKPEDEKKEDAE